MRERSLKRAGPCGARSRKSPWGGRLTAC